MTNLAHIAETAVLVLAAYLLGCVLGYGARRTLHAARGTRKVTVAPANVSPVAPVRPRTPAARLAATGSPDEALPAIPIAPKLPTKTIAQAPVAAEVQVKPKAPVTAKSPPKPKIIDPKPAALTAPRGGQADNLKQIKGIGPKIEGSLNALGIFHIDQIAGWTKPNVDWVDAQLAFKGRIRRERWVEQAIEFGKVKT